MIYIKLIFFLNTIKLQLKKRLKNEIKIIKDKTICFKFVLKIDDKLFTGKKPPDEINDIDKLNESKILIFNKFNTMKIKNVNDIYKINILEYCFNVSKVLKEIKFVKDFFKL